MVIAEDELGGFASSGAQAPAFIRVPATTLPCGITVPAFRVARYLSVRGRRGRVDVRADAAPWVNISYHNARRACARSGLALLTELQALAIAHDLCGQAVNWSGGAVGAGKLFQGLHKGRTGDAQPACVVPFDPEERRWHQLSNGERIVDFAGNAFSWVFDDVQGGPDGLVAHAFRPGTPSLATAPGRPMEQGLGWWPAVGREWRGQALARGGAFSSGEGCGVFLLVDEHPRAERAYIGFRCVLPG